ncbi:unnamed protein product [Cylindrotheca closterium]|uniref:Uncharacterized protein n=1 Tax=Cylindrotheca closterium TaxID=2856 RepID=A0AAD2JGD5_9STRA|nr:unnamed protein product [Cylindrotheca closterium]
MTAFRIGSVTLSKVSENRVRHHLRSVRENDSINQLFFFHVEFTDRILDDCRKLFVRDGRRFASIKVLFCKGKMSDIVTLLMDYSSTQALTVSKCEPWTLNTLNACLRTNQSLKALRISSSAIIGGTDCFNGLTVNNTLQELDLCGSHLGPSAIECLCQTLMQNTGLQTLKLDGCDMEDSAVASVVKAVLQHKTLTTLDLSNNAVSSKALEMVACLIQQNQQLKHLSIQSLRFSDELDPAIMFQAIVNLQNNTTLESLDISENRLTNAAIHGLCECLSKNQTLRHLDISNAGVEEEGIEILARNLGQFKGIQELNLSENDLTEEGAQSLLNGLQHNYSLASLGPIMEQHFKCSSDIEHYLDLNLAGRRALHSEIPLSIWPELLAKTSMRKNDLAGSRGRNENALFSLLHGPALFER